MIKHCSKLCLIVIAAFSVLVLSLIYSCSKNSSHAEDGIELGDWTPKFGGCGGVFFKAEKGPLVIEIAKQDLNNTNYNTGFRVVFAGPDRDVIEDQLIPDDGLSSGAGIGPEQTLRLETFVDRPGTYVVMVTASFDRYGEDIVWRFRTNCEKYMIETSRGHRDKYHNEPIVLKDRESETDLCFLPPGNAFELLVTDLPEDVRTLDLKDDNDRQIVTLEVENDTASYTIEPGNRMTTPWKLHFKKAQAKVEIEGVTGWNKNDKSEFFYEFPHGALWTPESRSWFPIHSNRWLVTPHKRVIYSLVGEEESTSFRIHNNGMESKKIALDLEFPDKEWKVQLSDKEVELAPNEEKEVVLSWTANQSDQIVHLRATNENYTTYSTLYAKAGDSRAKSPIDMPIVLKPYFQEQEQFGYTPDYPDENYFCFNIDNKPFMRTSDGVSSLQDGKWKNVKTDSSSGALISFDTDSTIYTIAKENGQAFLLYSKDGGQSFTSSKIPGNASNSFYYIEQFTGHNVPGTVPAITKYTELEVDETIPFMRYGLLELLIPKKVNNRIEWGQPILISKKSIGKINRSGIAPGIVSQGTKVFLCWGEVTDPNVGIEEIPGVPTYVTSYDRVTGKLEERVLIGYGAPPNDTHNMPGITIDSEGFLHVLTGTHGQPFHYARSLSPESVKGGWTKAKPVMKPGPPGYSQTQTYLNLVTGPDNTLHLVFRLWRYNMEYFPDEHFGSLAYMSKKPGEPWTEPRLLVVAPLSHYSIYRHRLTIDHKGRLFISYKYWSTYWFYRNERRSDQRTVLMSSDGGMTWRFLESRDLTI